MPDRGTDFTLNFRGGRNRRSRTIDIDHSECAEGKNFDIDLEFAGLRPRRPFDLIATATNAGSINGYAQLIKQDGSLSTLIQAGDTVYEWDGAIVTGKL